MKSGLLLLMVLAWITACATQEICDNNNQSEMVARFKTTDASGTVDTTLSAVTVYGIRPGRPDSLIYNRENASELILPLNPNSNVTTFAIDVNGVSDTLQINHRTEYYLISYNCGFAALFTLENLEYSSRLIRDSKIIQSVIDASREQNEEHIWLFF